MTIAFRPSTPDRAGSTLVSSGRVVGGLTSSEQFVLWALRQWTADGEATSPVLVHGFRLAFGLARLERALAAFEGLAQRLRLAGLVGPLRCASVSGSEEEVLMLLAVAQSGDGPCLGALAGRLAPEAASGLADAARALAAGLLGAGLALPSATPVPGSGPMLH